MMNFRLLRAKISVLAMMIFVVALLVFPSGSFACPPKASPNCKQAEVSDPVSVTSGIVRAPPRGNFSILTKNQDNTYTLRRKDGLKYAFDSNGRLTCITDSNDNRIILTYANGLLSSVTDPEGNTTAYTYDNAGNRTSMASSEGVHSYEYDKVYRIKDVEKDDKNFGKIFVRFRH